MMRILALLMSLFFISCVKDTKDEIVYLFEDKNDTVLICIGDIKVNWIKHNSEIVKDSLYIRTVVSKKKEDLIFLAKAITDTSITPIVYCKTNSTLKKGDLAFILMDKIYSLPYYQITGIQCDYFEKDCPYPVGLFEAINNNRNRTKENVLKYLENVR